MQGHQIVGKLVGLGDGICVGTTGFWVGLGVGIAEGIGLGDGLGMKDGL